MIDGTLGMAYGVSCRTLLKLLTAFPAPVISAVIHIAEIPSSFVSGISHLRIGNIDKSLLLRLTIPGVIGGIAGAWFLSGMGDWLEPLIDVYLIIMGIVILVKVFSQSHRKRNLGFAIYPLGLAGGFFDAAGSGGWGPIVTSTLAASGQDIKKTIGTVNASEFLVTVAEATTFIVLLPNIAGNWQPIAGLIVGGVAGAPLAARLCARLNPRPLLAAVGILIIGLNTCNLLNTII